MRIDAHQHFWRYTPAEYSWIDESMPAIRWDFLPADLAPLLAAHRLDGTVAVEARMDLREVRWLLELAGTHPFIKGVVGWVPLTDPGLAAILDELVCHPRFKGARHVVQGQPAGFLDDSAFNAGIRELTARGLTYDILIHAHQLEEATRFVDRHPQQAFILDHIAKPVVAGCRRPHGSGPSANCPDARTSPASSPGSSPRCRDGPGRPACCYPTSRPRSQPSAPTG